MGDLCLILPRKVGYLYLFFIAFLNVMFDGSFLVVDNLLKSVGFSLKGFAEIFQFLILHESVCIALVLYLFQLCLMDPLAFLHLQLFPMDFFSKLVLPCDLIIEGLLF